MARNLAASTASGQDSNGRHFSPWEIMHIGNPQAGYMGTRRWSPQEELLNPLSIPHIIINTSTMYMHVVIPHVEQSETSDSSAKKGIPILCT